MVKGVEEEKQEITITYETLFELLRVEKSREELQLLSATFFTDLANYVQEKKKILDDAEQNSDLFAVAERDKTRTQLENIRRIVKELYEKRERKMLFLAINKSRIGSHLIDTSPLLEEEEKFFEEMLTVLDKFRNQLLAPLLRGEDVSPQKEAPVQEEQAKNTKMLRFVKPVPKFVGKELEVYGPFEEEDMANLPVEVADVLIKKGRAQPLD